MAMQPPGNDPNPNRSFLAQLLMNIFNRGQPFAGAGGAPGGAGGLEYVGNQFPAAPGSGQTGMFPAAPQGGAPTDMSVMGPWGAGIDPAATAGTANGAPPVPTPRPQQLPQTGAPLPIGRPQPRGRGV
jgi:hypothetical protein